MNFPDNLKYSKSHEWVQTEGDTVICGISDYAQKEISDVVFIEVPQTGQNVKQGEMLAVVESVKAAFDIYAPLSGEVIASNKDLESDPGVINDDPYGKGWLFKIRTSEASEAVDLMDKSSYEKYIAEGAH